MAMADPFVDPPPLVLQRLDSLEHHGMEALNSRYI